MQSIIDISEEAHTILPNTVSRIYVSESGDHDHWCFVLATKGQRTVMLDMVFSEEEALGTFRIREDCHASPKKFIKRIQLIVRSGVFAMNFMDAIILNDYHIVDYNDSDVARGNTDWVKEVTRLWERMGYLDKGSAKLIEAIGQYIDG